MRLMGHFDVRGESPMLVSQSRISIPLDRTVQIMIAIILFAILATGFGGLLDRTAGAEAVNLVVNGSFEDPVVPGGDPIFDPGTGTWAHYSADNVPGWNTPPGHVIEIMRGNHGPAFAGLQYVELDANVGTDIFQDIETIPGTLYFLQYAFSPRPGTGVADNRMSVHWEGTQVNFHEADGSANDSTAWVHHSNPVTATGTSARIEFRYAGTPNSFGAFLDDVKVGAATCTSSQSGDWNDPATWNCGGVPGAGNDVVITVFDTVTLTGDQAANNITISGTLDNTGGHTLSVYGDWILNAGGQYQIAVDGEDEIKFTGEKQQRIDGKEDQIFNKLTVDKQKKLESDPEPRLDVQKKITVKKKLTLEKGETKFGDAEFEGDVEVKQDAKLSGTPDKTKTYKGDKTVDGQYEHNESNDKFTGDKDQKVTSEDEQKRNEKLEYYNLLIEKEKKQTDEDSQVKFEKDVSVKQKTEIDKGEARFHDAEFEGDVEVKEDAKLSGTPDKTKTYKGDKTVDGQYKHNESNDKFTGDKDQKVTSEDEQKRKEKLEYYNLLIEKEKKQTDEDSQVEFEKDVSVKQKTEIDRGEARFHDAEFEGDVEVKQDAILSGTPDKTKTYKGNKTVDGQYEHNESNDKFTGDKDQKVTSEDEQKRKEELEYYELLVQKQKKASQENSELEFEKQLKVEQKTTIEEGTLKTNTIFNEVVILEDGELILGEDDDPTEVLGDWVNSGTFNAGIGTVIFNGTETQSISGTSQSVFNNLTIENDTVITGSIKVDGTLKVSGTLSLGEGGGIEQGDNFNLEVGSGAMPGVGCVPGGKHLTGGGWFDSPAGADLANPDTAGKAHFELSVHCSAEGSEPTGGVSFSIGSIELASTALDSMIVLGNKATVTGFATLNHSGNYGFALEAVEGAPGNSGAPNRIRVVIWEIDGDTVYESDLAGDGPIASGGGNIMIHSKAGGGPAGGPPGQGTGGPPGNGPGGNGPPGR